MRIAILTTGGTIEKTYNETDGSLRNVDSVLDDILRGLRLPGLTVRHIPVMQKDSLYMTDEDREIILAAVSRALPDADAVIVVHGTDTLALTGEHLHRGLVSPSGGAALDNRGAMDAMTSHDRPRSLDRPVVLTGAMRPYEFRDTDAVQNMTEALLACRLLPPGVHVVMHNQALTFPGVTKDADRRTFVRTDS